MWETFSNASAFSLFLGIGALGFLFLLASFLLGEVSHVFDSGHNLEHDLEHDLDHDDGPGFFNTRVISIFLTAFGGIGALMVSRGFGAVAGSIFGLAGGLVFGFAVYLFARFLYSQQASSLIDSSDLVGLRAKVIVDIPEGGSGQVRCIVGESMVEKIARSVDGSAIPHDSTVLVESISGESVVVSPWSADERSRGLFYANREP